MAEFFASFGFWGEAVWIVIKILVIVAPLLMAVAYLTYAERKVLSAMHLRRGPNVVGPWGLLQPIADGLKLFLKETVIPSGANRAVFLLAPCVTFILALVSNRSIFGLAVWSFTGFAALFPVVAAALFWKRSTREGALAAIVSVVVLWIYFFNQGSQTPGYTVGGTGVMPVVVILAVSTTAMVVVSLITKPPEESVIQSFFQE